MLTFRNLIILLLQQLQRSLKRELQDFVNSLQENGADLASISAAAFCKARKKLKYTAFIELNQVFTQAHYKYGEKIWRWKQYRLFAVDGSTVEVPNEAENLALWGVFKQREDGKKICMARTLQVYDVLNRLVIGAEIDSIKTSESELWWKLLPTIVNEPPLEQSEDLFIFDRFFASHLLIFHLYACNKDFCFRMKKDWWKVCETFYNSGEESEVVRLELPKKDAKKADELGIMVRSILVRLVRIPLQSGEVEILLSSLTDEQNVSVAEMKELYGYRWPVETNYRMLKHKVHLENFSGKSINSIKQDYYAKIMILNFASALVNPIDDLLKEHPKKKHTHQSNFTNAIASLKKAVVDCFFKHNFVQTIEKIIEYLIKTTEPIRKGRKFERPKLPKRKYHRNYTQV